MMHCDAKQSWPRLIAHRGVPATHPENTIIGLRAAVEAGARYVEFDVQMSADGVPVLSHDESLERTTGMEGVVMDWHMEQLRAIHASESARFGDTYHGNPIATLADAVAYIATTSIELFFVDTKDASIERFGIETFLNAIMQELGAERRRAVITCQNLKLLHQARQHGMPVAWVAVKLDDVAKRNAEQLRPEYIFCPLEEVEHAGPQLWPGPWKWAVYGVENIEDATFVTKRGAHFIETKTIATMLADPRVHDLSMNASCAC